MEKQLLQVKEFQVVFETKIPECPTMLKGKRKRLRQDLLEEEVMELRKSKNIVDVADALMDILYITYGTIHEYGLADRAILLFDEVHSSNMSKVPFDNKPIYREDGKVLKPDTYRKPNLEPIIDRNFNLYKNSNVMNDIANMQREENDKKITKKVIEKLNVLDRLIFWISEKIDKRLKRKISVSFPITVNDNIVVNVYGVDYEIV